MYKNNPDEITMLPVSCFEIIYAIYQNLLKEFIRKQQAHFNFVDVFVL
jgi:hypothetical protein